MSVTSTDYIKTDVTATAPALGAVVSTRAAFLTHDGSPTEADWIAAELEDGAVRVLVGPGGHPLAAGTYRMWGEITAPPVLFREPAGLVTITP